MTAVGQVTTIERPEEAISRVDMDTAKSRCRFTAAVAINAIIANNYSPIKSSQNYIASYETMKYRAEIDGLRALAVIPVILFHTGLPLFDGGFVGVDVFFVISGYLITTIIINELDQGRFSVVDFYERRARRILPALFLVIFACIPFAWYWLLPSDMKSFSQSLIAASIFASNIFFWHESGYFDTAAELKPLLHTWSLAIEEQFYLLFPLFLAISWKLGRRKLIIALGIILIISLAISHWASYAKPAAAFYLLPTRGWELLIGALVAFALSRPNQSSLGKTLPEFFSWLGVALILFSVFTYSKKTPFPGFPALIPTLGTALIILFASPYNSVGKLMSNKLFVGVGLISYSAYLWHQPLFAFARHRSLTEPSISTLLLLSLVSLVLAYFSWKFVELPFRNKEKVPRKSVFIFSAIGSLGIVLYGLAGHKTNGFIDNPRWDPIRKIEKIKEHRASGFRLCENKKVSTAFKFGLVCVLGDDSVAPSGIIWGDSFAGSAVYGIDNHLRANKKSYYAVLSDGCPPLPGISRKKREFDCFHDRQQDVLNTFNADDKLSDLIWIGRFQAVAGSSPPEGFLIDNKPPSLEIVQDKFIESIASLNANKKRVVIVLEGPSFLRSIPDYIAKTFLLGASVSPSVTETSVSEQRKRIGLAPEFFSQFENIAYVDGIDLFCKNSRCNAILDNGSPMVADGSHISHDASTILANEIFKKLDQLNYK